MDIRYLEYILVLAETGNMTRAAKKLYISQPSLSQFLTKQEAELGTPLFTRSNGVYSLTPVGELYADYARKVLSLTNHLEKDIQRISTTTRISIGTSFAAAQKMLITVLSDFRKYYPNVELTLSESNLQYISNAILAGELDMAFVAAPSLEPYKGHCIELLKEEVLLAAPSTHPYCQTLPAGEHHILTNTDFLKHFGSTPLILQLKGYCIRYLIDDFWGNNSFSPVIACNISHAQSICEMVASNIGAGFIPTVYAIDSPHITYFSLEPRMYRIHSLIYRKDLELGPPLQHLIQLAQNYIRENPEHFLQKFPV